VVGPANGPLAAVAARVAELAEEYRPPDFDHVPDPDAAIFLCAVDHRTGYRGRYLVDGDGPHDGSSLLWATALRSARRRPGLLTSARLAGVTAAEVGDAFRIGGETVVGAERRAELWRDLARGLNDGYDGSAQALLDAAQGMLAGPGGVLDRLARFEAYRDPLAKKSFLFAKIAERRGWLEVADPEHWQVCADNVLMRLALRSGLVEPGPLAQVRPATRDAFARVAAEAGLSPAVLDDLLWELGREDPDLVGAVAGAVSEPEREPGSDWY
jgi:hypothetical protein